VARPVLRQRSRQFESKARNSLLGREEVSMHKLLWCSFCAVVQMISAAAFPGRAWAQSRQA